ncbi:flagellar hook assembly protein FlgD [Endozoicomonadaceae bacterium StTr2]
MNVNGVSGSSNNAPAAENKSLLDSDAFMKLLLTQMKHQDPTKPMESSEIVTQLSNLSMVASASETRDTVEALRKQIYSSQSLYAHSLVGQQVVAVANTFRVDEGDPPVNGKVMLPGAADGLKLNIYDEDDKLVSTLDLGAQTKGGPVNFDLANLKEPLKPGKYRFEAKMESGGKKTDVAVAQRSVVNSVVIPGNGKEILVDVDDIGLVPLSLLLEVEGKPKNSSGAGGVQGLAAPVGQNPFFVPPEHLSALQKAAFGTDQGARALPPGPAALALSGK